MPKKLVIGGVNLVSTDDDYGYPFEVPTNDPGTDYYYYINSYIEIEDGSVKLKDSGTEFTTTISQPVTPTEDHEIRLPDGADDAAGASVMSDGSGNWVYDFAGDVAGPISSTNHAVPRFIGTDGQVLGNTSAIIDDSNNFEIPGNITSTSGNLYGSAVSTTTGTITGALAVGNLTAGGIVRSNGDGGGDTHFDGYILAADTQPAIRLNSYPTARMELGPGGSTASDVSFLRTGSNAAALALGGSNQITFSTSAVNFSPTLEVGQNGIKFYENSGNGTNFVKLVAGASLSGDVTFYLPVADGSNGQFIKTNGSGQLSFATASGGSGIDVYDDPDTLVALGDATVGAAAMIKSYGLARWVDNQQEPEDYETVFNTTTGQWLLELVHPDLPYYLFGVIVGDGGSIGQYLQTNGNGTYSWVTVSTQEITDWTSTTPVTSKEFTGLDAKTIEFELVCTVTTAATGANAFNIIVNGIVTGYTFWGYCEDDSANAWTRIAPVSGQVEGAIIRIDEATTDGQQMRARGSVTVLPNGKMAYRSDYETFGTSEGGFYCGYGSSFGTKITSLKFADTVGGEFQFAVDDYIKLWKKR